MTSNLEHSEAKKQTIAQETRLKLVKKSKLSQNILKLQDK